MVDSTGFLAYSQSLPYGAYRTANSIPDAKKPPVADPNKVDKEASDIALANRKKRGYGATMVAGAMGPQAAGSGTTTIGQNATLGV
jgi:hypothetical protein